MRDRLARLGIFRLSDLVLHLPLRYEDETRIVSIHDALSGETVQIEGTVRKTEVKFRPGRQLVSDVDDGSGRVMMRCFNFYPSQQKALAPGARVRVLGEIRTAARLYKDGYDWRDVECAVIKDWQYGEILYIRTDTCELAYVENMTQGERQRRIEELAPDKADEKSIPAEKSDEEIRKEMETRGFMTSEKSAVN